MTSAKLKNRRVLIADDQPEIHTDFSEMLEPARPAAADELAAAFIAEDENIRLPAIELLHASSGEEAVAAVEEAIEAGRPIAVAYIDIRMPPGMDGITAAQRIRKMDREIEIVIMTAYTDKPLSEIIRDVELLHKLLYLRKPFTREEVQQITLSLVEKWNVEQELARKRRQLTSSHRRLEAVLDATGDAMAMYEPGGRLVFANRGYGELFGMTDRELEKASPDALQGKFRASAEAPEAAGMAGLEGALVIDDGSNGEGQAANGQKLFRRFTAPVRNDGQDVMGSLVVYRDVSSEVEISRMKAEVLRLQGELETTWSFSSIVGTSPPMRQVYALMKQAAESDITTLILGESGTGKELVAKQLHFNSLRKAEAFEVINCVAIPETLIESELFGHEKGAFTGAATRRLGVFERASGGTVFLDEIGDMPPALQPRLLRVLQEREVQRVGGSSQIPVDVRVIAATNKDLENALRQGSFRPDLFYRIAAFPIRIPALRERREDIPLLAKHFLKKHAEQQEKPLDGFSAAALRLLLRYDWPGNVRELENAVERAVLLETGRVVQEDSLPAQLSPRAGPAQPGSLVPLVEVERQALKQALESSGNNVTEAARRLGIDRTTLYRKLKKHKLSRNP